MFSFLFPLKAGDGVDAYRCNAMKRAEVELLLDESLVGLPYLTPREMRWAVLHRLSVAEAEWLSDVRREPDGRVLAFLFQQGIAFESARAETEFREDFRQWAVEVADHCDVSLCTVDAWCILAALMACMDLWEIRSSLCWCRRSGRRRSESCVCVCLYGRAVLCPETLRDQSNKLLGVGCGGRQCRDATFDEVRRLVESLPVVCLDPVPTGERHGVRRADGKVSWIRSIIGDPRKWKLDQEEP